MSTVFGPVPSRRLGRSLGVDPVPFKTCNWNCVYCQLGRTSPHHHQRREYLPTDALLAELAGALRQHGPGEIDWITFVGSGEPTLHIDLGHMLRRVKAMTTIPVAVITNGALLYRADVRHDLSTADAVMPTVSAGSEEMYLRLHRPARELAFSAFVQGLSTFRQGYVGKLWVEVMLVRGLNDTEEALQDLVELLEQVGPDEIHVTLPSRPPGEPWVEPSDAEGLARAAACLRRAGPVLLPAAAEVTTTLVGELDGAIEAIISRHPMSAEELERALPSRGGDEVQAALTRLRNAGRAREIERGGGHFWTTPMARYTERRVHT